MRKKPSFKCFDKEGRKMSVIMDFNPERVAKVFFGSAQNDVKRTVILTVGIPWLFEKINKRKFVVRRNKGWWNLSVIRCDGSDATIILVGSGSSNVTDVVRLLTKFSCKNIVGVGLAGALRRDIQIGDIIVPVCSIQAYHKSVREAVSH
jgi:purine-nucleoside phosphorylase